MWKVEMEEDVEGSGGGGCGRLRWRRMWKVEVEEDVEG